MADLDSTLCSIECPSGASGRARWAGNHIFKN